MQGKPDKECRGHTIPSRGLSTSKCTGSDTVTTDTANTQRLCVVLTKWRLHEASRQHKVSAKIDCTKSEPEIANASHLSKNFKTLRDGVSPHWPATEHAQTKHKRLLDSQR